MSVANARMKTVARLALGTALVTVLSGCENRFGQAFGSLTAPLSKPAETTVVYQPTPAPGNPTYIEGSHAANLQTFESVYGAPVTGPSSVLQQSTAAYSIPSYNDGAVAIAPLSAPVETPTYSVAPVAAAVSATTLTPTFGVSSVASTGLTYGDTLTSSAYQLDTVAPAPVTQTYETYEASVASTPSYATLEPSYSSETISGSEMTSYALPAAEPMPAAETMMAPASSYIEPMSTFDTQVETYQPMTEPMFGETVTVEPMMAEPMMVEQAMAEPFIAEPMMVEPVMAKPIMDEPVMMQPEMVESSASTLVYDQPAAKTMTQTSTFDQPALEAETLGGQYGVVTPQIAAQSGAADSAEMMWQSLVNEGESVMPAAAAPSPASSGVTIMPVSEIMETMSYNTTAGSEITTTPTPRQKAAAQPKPAPQAEPMVMAALTPVQTVVAAAPLDLGPVYAPAPRARPTRALEQASYTTVAMVPSPQPRPDFERPVTIATSAGVTVEETMPAAEPAMTITSIEQPAMPAPEADIEMAAVAPEPVSVASTIRADDSDLSGTSWRLISVAGRAVTSNAELHFDGDSGFAGGQGPCNSYGGEYSTAKQGTFGMANIFTTSMACPNLEVEKSYIEALESAGEYVIAPGFAELELRNAEGETVVKFKAF